MHIHPLTHPWQLATTWTVARRRSRTLPDDRSHFYPSRCVYLESSSMSRLMDHL
ncbi:hypothetical protein [Mycolicibacterium litorale]|uniref:Uncharacterized protein n=1 Tax=Mycolicibacterium litorale TaxID=758802 RepID=A0AAD1MUM4_9MYCO|nr:hypothetical protein [Mycolicibacterium litorale]MCV7415347.1 hypothetical protein [Mycolicibacterium litorale]TDY08601.1 hypothetical protein BCL50_0670 [Mycolicibacterium litorale]BBY16527.1 hypothetical protein MLIT_21190 [Mycolicibacterium litorale]